MNEGTRIEIQKGQDWLPLRLSDNARIKFNKVINRIGTVESRDISHTNTFELAPVWQNIQALDINIYNPRDLAKALNRKYPAKYYVEDKIVQSGFLIINNTNDGIIKVNFIDESLSIVELWGSTTYRELLRSTTLPFDTDYQDSIDELTSYDMDKTAVLTPLTEVGTRGYNLCLFPNNLNAIGDKFQLNDNEERVDDSFNPYQSRPIFNARSLFDLGTVGFGYTPIFDPSVDWDRVSRTYMVDKGLLESAKGNNGIQQVQYPTVSSAGTPFFVRVPDFLCTIACFSESKHLYDFPPSRSITPASVANFSEPLLWGTYTGPPFNNPPSQPWLNQNVLFVPSVEAGNVGVINIKANTLVSNTNADFTQVDFVAIWENATPGGPTIDNVVASRSPFSGITGPLVEVIPTTKTEFEFELDKAVFDTAVPAGANPDGLIGLSVVIGKSLMTSATFNMGNLIVTETFLPEGVVAYDDFGQYLPDVVDLTHAAPNESIKKLLIGIMQKEGILMNIDAVNKEVKFFTYGAYTQQMIDGNFSDWSQYLQRYNPFLHNTDYGGKYAKINRVGLSNPYQGNTFDYVLNNQGEDSKYKEFTTNYLATFKDVENIKEILNTVTPYLEFENKGLGLVEYTGNLGQLSQQRADGTIQGNFTGLAIIENVNGADLPQGMIDWYKLVDEAVRVDSEYLIPTEVIRTLDLSEPIFVEELGGFYIIEEIAEYTSSRKLVTVKLIKLVFEPFASAPPPPGPSISLTSNSNQDFIGTYRIANLVTFLNYIPNSATIRGRQLINYVPGFFGNPGTYDGFTGFEFNDTLTLPPYVNNNTTPFVSNLPIGTEEGWYLIQVTDGDDSLLVSNEAFAYLGDPNPPPPDPLINIIKTNGITDIVNDEAAITISYDTGFTPTNPQVYVQRVQTGTSLPIGSPVITNISPTDVNVVVPLTVTGSSYQVTVRSDGEISNELGWTRIL